IERLKTHDWPGNVLELENLLRRLAVLSPVSLITAGEIEGELKPARTVQIDDDAEQSFEDALDRRFSTVFAGQELPEAGLYDRVLAEVESPLIRHALNATRGNQIRAAAVLGINRNTLRKKIQLLGIRTGRGD